VSKRWTRVIPALIVGAAGLLVVAVLGLNVFMHATKTPLHPDPQALPSTSQGAPAAAWAAAVEQARLASRDAVLEQNLPGLSVAVGAGGELVWAEGFGWGDLERRVPVSPDTAFRIGTASIPITSALVGLLLEEGRLALDEPIQAHVPAFPEKPWPVTLRQVMAHVAGIRRDAGDEEPVWEPCERTADALPRFADRPLLFEPGTNFRRSTYGWMLVSAAVEGTAGEPFFRVARRRVLEPLAMTRTTFDSPTDPGRGRAVYYFPQYGGDPRFGPQPPDEVDYSCFSGAAGFITTPSDLVRFGLAVMGGTLLQPATVQLLQSPQRLASGADTGDGLGWQLATVDLAGTPARLVGHDGEMRGGMVASFMTFPEHGLVVAVTANTSFADTRAIGLRVAQAFIEHRPRDAGR
jgi:CubicO group peptidase (beta-lactamase class C family)